MDDYVKYLMVLVVMVGTFFCIDNYTQGKKAERALGLGYEECSEVDNYNNTIILYKKDCNK
jgi:hypothetical protein